MSESLGVLLQRAFLRHLRAEVMIADLQQLTGGAASATWRFTARTDAQPDLVCILRRSPGAAASFSGVDKRTEAKVQEAVRRTGTPVAAVRFVLDDEDGLGEGFVMEWIEGEAIPQKIFANPAFAPALHALAEQCAQMLAAIHTTPAEGLPSLPALDAAGQLQAFERSYRDSGEQLPVFELALRWLSAHLPEPPTHLRLVHGDFRTGNFLMTPERGITAVLDWELCHLGDPMEDLGWLCVNSWRFGRRDQPVGGFAQRAPFFEAYARAAGAPVDEQRVHFWELFGVLKWGIMCLMLTGGHLSGAERSVERAAIGRRVSETEIDLLQLLGERN